MLLSHLCPDTQPAGFKGAINLNLTGSGGQSFGVFLAGGINVKLVGEANDYVGKGMAGGEIVIVPPADAGFVAEEASIVGNTCLYGATGRDPLFVGLPHDLTFEYWRTLCTLQALCSVC
jgi:glutamate synthase domain-containing protein 3